MLNNSNRLFGPDLHTTDLQGSAKHQTVLAAYDKLFVTDANASTA